MDRRQLMVAGAVCAGQALAGEPLRFPLGDDPADTRNQFSAELLQLARRQTGAPRPVVAGGSMNQIRALVDLAAGRLDVALISNTEVLPPTMRAVPFPVRQGLLGIRLLVTTPDRRERLSQVPDEATLRRDFTLGYGHDWQDRNRFERMGYRLVTANNYRGLFAMMLANRSDYLSRAVSEVMDELARPELNRDGHLVIVPGLALRYPLDDAFVVRADEVELYQHIVKGLHTALRDGSYWALFDQHYGPALQWAGLQQRRIWPLKGYAENPDIERAQNDLLLRRRAAGPASWR